jgi:hypothetical protein
MALFHFKWVTFPSLDGNTPTLTHQRGREYYLPTQFEKEPIKYYSERR